MWHTGGNPGIGMKVKRCVQLSIGCWNAFLLELFEITVRQFAWQTAVEIVGSTKYLAKWNCNYRAFIHQSGSVQTRSIGNSILLIRSVPNKVQPCETGHVLFIVPGDFHRQACHVWTVERLNVHSKFSETGPQQARADYNLRRFRKGKPPKFMIFVSHRNKQSVTRVNICYSCF